MDKTPPPLLGFNNNVRHHGRIFHIQTEDSGVKHARIVTHLFADGGRIVKTTRTDYAEHLGRPDMIELLRRVMKEQHKAMFIRLRAGELDSLIETACGPFGPKPNEAGRPAAAPSALAAATAPAAQPDLTPEPSTSGQSPAPEQAPPPRRRHLSNPNLLPVPPSVTPPPGEIELDEELLAGNDTSAAPRRSTSPPRGTPATAVDAALVAPQAEQPELDGTTEQGVGHGPPRPPNIFEAQLTEHSLYGERLIREKSLDEVILSYLAEDLEEGSKRK